MKIDLGKFRQTFIQESAENVVAMEAGLLDLRATPTDIELMNAIFRSAHSIKGGAGSFGLNNLVRLTHALENLLDRLRALNSGHRSGDRGAAGISRCAALTARGRRRSSDRPLGARKPSRTC
jgi:chemotaxis protein histidine kinase CheA